MTGVQTCALPISTPISLIEARAGAPDTDIIASGGINSGLLAAKSFALGAKTVGIAGMAAKILLSEGKEVLVSRLNNVIKELKIVMVMTGCSSIEELRQTPIVITGQTRQWLDSRGLGGQV